MSIQSHASRHDDVFANVAPAGREPSSPFLQAVVTCVGYDDFLDVTLGENLHHFDEFVVATAHEDRATQKVCAKHGVICVSTDVFRERPHEPFNKGRAINLALSHLVPGGWRLHCDADIVLPDDFRNMLARSRLDANCIYGADRLNIVGRPAWEELRRHPRYQRQYQHRFLLEAAPGRMGARLIHRDHGYTPIGYFQLWHSATGRIYPPNQGNAERADVVFACQWPAARRHLLPSVIVYHLESQPAKMGANWNGRTTARF